LDYRKLGTAGQKLGGAAVLCHIKHDPMDPGGSFTLTSANVGKCQTVLCRNGKPLPLSRSYVISCEEEMKRIKQHKAIVTEVSGEGFSSDGQETAARAWKKPVKRPFAFKGHF
jgi:serine/threonine protein phosphatase PrpC